MNSAGNNMNSDRELGLDRSITRRDFLNGVSLSIVGAVLAWRDPRVRWLTAIGTAGVIFALGANSVFHGVLYAIVPMVEKARSSSFGIFIFHFGIIVLTSYAIDSYLSIPTPWIRRTVWTVLLTSAAVLLAELVLNMTQVPKALDFVRRRGPMAVVLGRWVAALRALVPGIAGVSGMRPTPFTVANVTGGALWATAMAVAGYLAGASFRLLEHRLGVAGEVLLGVLVLVLVVLAVRHRIRESRQPDA